MAIQDSLKKRAHVVHYKTDDIPTRDTIERILRTGYPLATSKQNAFPYKVWVLGPNVNRSNKLYQMTEQNKIDFDGDVGDKYHANPNLFHVKSAPEQCELTGTQWEMGDEDFIPRGRESWSIEVGMVAKTITGAVCDEGLDTSYCICFPKQVEKWQEAGDFPFIKHFPYLIQTIGKADLYKWQNMSEDGLKKDTRAPFNDVFEFVD